MTFEEALYYGIGAVGLAIAITAVLFGFLIVKSGKKHGDQ